jgi:hypothetical protein
VLNTQLPANVRLQAVVRSAVFYSTWYPRQWIPIVKGGRFHRQLGRHVRYAERTAHRLARTLFHAMARFGPKLEREQVLLGRFVDIGTELFAITATCARFKIKGLFDGIADNADKSGYQLAQEVLAGHCDWLENGILR